MLMRFHLIPLALALLLTSVLAARADFVVGARIGDSFVIGGSEGVQARIVLGSDRTRARPRDRAAGSRLGRPGQLHSRIGLSRERDRHQRRPHRPLLIVPIRERTRVEPETPPVEPQPKPTPPAKPAAFEAKAAPDPLGHARIVRARGVTERVDFAIGSVLPQDVPHVTLDARRFDLPPPPAGQIYARIRDQVYLIDPDSRLIRGRLALTR